MRGKAAGRTSRVRTFARNPSSPLPRRQSKGKHDENISIAEMEEAIGKDLSEKIIQTSFALFEAASEHAEKSGIILCDTKFEFGQIDGQLILIDEVFTPDSSRFWPKDEYKPGSSPPSFGQNSMSVII